MLSHLAAVVLLLASVASPASALSPRRTGGPASLAVIAPPATLTPDVLLVNASDPGEPNRLAQFVDTTPTGPPLMADSCPDDIFAHLIKQPMPKLPYRIRDGYDRAQRPNVKLPAFTLESAHLRAKILPLSGGKVASLERLPTAGGAAAGEAWEAVFRNPVFQPANLARLNAWTSGGIEWNWPRFGHTVFTAAPVFVARVDTSRGPLVRIYEFDRELLTVWQVDVFLPANTAAAFAHVTLRNPFPEDLEAYWWTNIAVPWTSNETRVLTPCPYAIMSSPEGLRRQAFPITDDCGGDPTFDQTNIATDHSRPSAFGDAREVFLRPPSDTNASALLWSSYVDGNNRGLVHLQSPVLNGRKFWAWGNDPHDLYRMEFLSSDSVPGSGRYFEMQSGVAPTQFQTFAFPANTTLEWTEAFVPIDASADPAAKAKLQAADYSAATAYMEQLSQAVVSEAVFADIDAFLSQHKDVPVSEILANGTDFGALYYKRTGVARPAGLSFPDQTSSEETEAWRELLDKGTFVNALAKDPESFMVHPEWVTILQASMAAHGETWLHHLHLGVAAMYALQYDQAMHYFSKSLALKEGTHQFRNMAWLAAYHTGDQQSALHFYNQSLQHALSDSAASETLRANIASEMALYLIERGLTEELAGMLAGLPTALYNVTAIKFARALVLAQGPAANNPNAVIAELQATKYPFNPVGSQTFLVELWYGAWYKLQEAKVGHALDDVDMVRVRRAHPPPPHIDFRGAS